MSTVQKTLVGLAILALLLAVFVSLTAPIRNIPAETFSRASNNLALIAIALAVVFKQDAKNS